MGTIIRRILIILSFFEGLFEENKVLSFRGGFKD
jgi:hypothetical protein